MGFWGGGRGGKEGVGAEVGDGPTLKTHKVGIKSERSGVGVGG